MGKQPHWFTAPQTKPKTGILLEGAFCTGTYPSLNISLSNFLSLLVKVALLSHMQGTADYTFICMASEGLLLPTLGSL